MLSKDLRAFYEASPMKEGVLCWYPFLAGASVLDLSGGALNRLLRERCGSVSVEAASGGKQFDYVVVMDTWDFSVEALKALYERLNAHGRLLFAYENPFAMRYWSGKRSPKNGLQYDALFGWDGRVSAAELRMRLERAGFEGQKWYYPLTDHWFAWEVYSENYLPDEYFNQRFLAYIDDDDDLAFDERWLYREVVRNGAFPFLCGAYLVEARACALDEPCPVDYAAVTASRAPSKRFATTVRSDGTVRKTPLHEDGLASLQNTLRNHQDLAALGVNVLEMTLADGELVMPKLDLPTLFDYWAKKLTDGTFDPNELYNHYDRIRDAIYRASANGKCYWELVPANCFYDAESDDLIFFDQEYCWEGVSPDVAVVRALWALKYSLAFRDDERVKECVQALIGRYNLAERWDELSKLADEKTREEVFGEGTAALSRASDEAARKIAAKWDARWNEGLYQWEDSRRRQEQIFRPAAGRLKSMGFRSPAIYGYGKRGKELQTALEDAEVNIAAIIDKKLRMYASLEQLPKDSGADVIIVSIWGGAPVADELRAKTGLPVYTLEELTDDGTH